MITLKDHQKTPINFIKNNFGLILYHSTGSGKTLTALFSMYQFDRDIIIIGPKSSRKAFNDNIKKGGLNPSRFKFFSFQKAYNILHVDLDLFANKSVIVDEAHHLRTESQRNLMITSALSLSFKIALLTATPVINYLNDIAVLVNIVKNKEVLPTERHLFNHIYFDEEELELKNEPILYTKLRDSISYYKIKNDPNYPTHKTHYKEVTMNQAQLKEYVKYIKKFFGDKKGIDDLDINLRGYDKRKVNAFMVVTRQLSNTVNNDPNTPKIESIFNIVKKGPFPIVVYSNFLKNGIYTLATHLEKTDLSYKLITGNTTHDKINRIVNDYNSKRVDVLLLSSAGSESLNLKRTRQIHIMEPHWNESKIIQVIGRAIRYKSHNDLKPSERHVDVYRWISIFPKPIKNESADQYLTNISKKKKEIWKKFKKIIEESSIEKNKRGGYRILYKRYKRLYLDHKNKNLMFN